MGYGIGVLLSLAVAGFARLVGFDRDRAFYATVLIVVALVLGIREGQSGTVPYTRDSTANSGRRSALSRAARWLAQVLQPSSMSFLTVRGWEKDPVRSALIE